VLCAVVFLVWRPLTLPIAFAWTAFAAWAAWVDFAPGNWATWGLVVSSLWLISAGVLQQILPERPGAEGRPSSGG
jgi:phosphatidylcholine synthase